MPRIMTWNCRGAEDRDKWDQILNYKTAKAIDCVFLQEGTSLYVNNDNIFAYDEKHDAVDVSNTYNFDDTGRTGQALYAAFNRQDYSGVTGDGQNKIYSVILPVGSGDPNPSTPDYAIDHNVSGFITRPIDDMFTAQAAAAALGGKRKREEVQIDVSRGRRGGWQIANAAGLREAIQTRLKEPAERRINLLGRRRPRKVVIPIGGANYNVYFWHSPLGNVTLEHYGLERTYPGIKGNASGGDLALVVNILFANYLGIDAAFPADTLLLGDLNINATAAKKIYKTDNVLSSLDGWCHAIAPATDDLAQQFAGDFVRSGSDYKTAGALAAIYPKLVSDHAPVIFDIG